MNRYKALKSQFTHSLVGYQLPSLSLSKTALKTIEPSQVGSTVGSLLDSLLACWDEEEGYQRGKLGLKRQHGLGDRESYPDFTFEQFIIDFIGRIELKNLFVDSPHIDINRPSSAREPSARLKISQEEAQENDYLLVLAYRFEPSVIRPKSFSPVIIDLDFFSVEALLKARDSRVVEWHGQTPMILGRNGQLARDTNFGKLKRIPYAPLQSFLKCHGYGSKHNHPRQLPKAYTND